MNMMILAGCVIISNKNILLLHRTKRNCYELPGGKVKEGESPEEAAVREIREELNCDVELVREIGEKEFEEDGRVMLYKWYLARIKGDKSPVVGEPEVHDHIKYLPVDMLDEYRLSSNMKSLANELRKGSVKIV